MVCKHWPVIFERRLWTMLM